ncbi:unnamed protein product [Musa textilis]
MIGRSLQPSQAVFQMRILSSSSYRFRGLFYLLLCHFSNSVSCLILQAMNVETSGQKMVTCYLAFEKNALLCAGIVQSFRYVHLIVFLPCRIVCIGVVFPRQPCFRLHQTQGNGQSGYML